MLQPWQDATVTKIVQETPHTKRFWLSMPSNHVFEFTPGQFITLDLPIHEQKNKRWRSYSIASAPNGCNEIELVIVFLEGGLGTTYLFNEVTVGTIIKARGPQGVFVLPKEITTDLYFICTGTGVAPFRSMILDIHQKKTRHQNIHLLFGCRKYTDCLYGHEFKSLEAKEPQFYYHPSFSRETEIQEGANQGYVHATYKKLLDEGASKDAQFYICGWKDMVDEARTTLATLGIPKNQIHFELYG
jgi:CDP-4-dehydro-6-deoxyglucose reductase